MPTVTPAAPNPIDPRCPFAAAVLATACDGAPLQAAVDALRNAEAASGLWIVDGVDADLGDGTFVPRDGRSRTTGEVRRLARSWEAFDRTFDPQSGAASREREHRRLWPFLDDTCLLLGGVDFARDHVVVFDDGAVASWSPSSWARLLAEWARGRRLGDREDWHQDAFIGSLEPIWPRYGPWRDAARAAIARARAS
jgi:hypothetical protein